MIKGIRKGKGKSLLRQGFKVKPASDDVTKHSNSYSRIERTLGRLRERVKRDESDSGDGSENVSDAGLDLKYWDKGGR